MCVRLLTCNIIVINKISYFIAENGNKLSARSQRLSDNRKDLLSAWEIVVLQCSSLFCITFNNFCKQQDYFRLENNLIGYIRYELYLFVYCLLCYHSFKCYVRKEVKLFLPRAIDPGVNR